MEEFCEMLQSMKQVIEDVLNPETPNAETIAAMEEVDKMIRSGTGQHFTGSTADLFAAILAEDD